MRNRVRSLRYPTEPDDAGAALIMSVIVMLILTTLSVAVLGRTLSVLNFVRTGQDFDAALASADAGIADALYKIDQSAPASWTSTCPAANATAPCPVGQFTYWATKRSDTEYVVSSVGTAGKSKHGAQVRVVRTAQFPYALFSNGPLHLDGAASAGNVKVSFYAVAGSGDVRVGSNSTVVCNGTLPSNVLIDWYQTQSECPTTRVNKLEKPRDLTIREPVAPLGNLDPNWENCPFPKDVPVAAGVPGAALIGSLLGTPSTTTVVGGDYVCRRDVRMLGTVVPATSGPPVKLYILPRTDAGVVTNYKLDMSAAIVNPDYSATRFQIYKAGDKPIVHNTASDVLTFRGVLFAPATSMTINGGKLSWAGSINVGQLTVNGAPNLQIGYDFDLATYLGPDWKVSRYREIPSSEAKFVT